ncbi:MAG: hypothetical protein WD073_01380 [Xanthobacteraceae bacterium]
MSYAMDRQSRHGARRMARGLLMLPLLLFSVVTVTAAGYVAYVLWPRWPGLPVAPDAPSLPIVVAGVAFNVPPAAIRRPVQRRPGVQERIDLIFVWPSLAPPASAAEAGPHAAEASDAEKSEAAKPLERIFVTIAGSEGAAPPLERMKTIYARYLAQDVMPAPSGLVMFSFRKDTPYQGEDLIYAPEMPERFLLRCTGTVGPTPGTCLHERRVGAADVMVRFPRAWLDDWRGVAAGIDRLIAKLGPHTS